MQHFSGIGVSIFKVEVQCFRKRAFSCGIELRPNYLNEWGSSMRKLMALAVLSLPFALAECSHPQPVVYAPPPPPPPAFTEIGQRGYHDGIEAARRDIAAGRAPNAEHHPRFRNPPVPPPAWEDYRHGFREGYRSMFRNGPPPPPPGPGY